MFSGKQDRKKSNFLMRIAFDHHAFLLQSYGGISRYYARLAQNLIDMEQRVHIFAPLHRNRHLSVLPSTIVTGRYVQWLPPIAIRLAFAYNQLQSRSQISQWKPDLLHETYYSRGCIAPQRCPAVITVYDMIHELFPVAFSKRDQTAVVKRIATRRASHIICISENTKQDLMCLHDISAEKITVIHLGFDEFAQPDATERLVAITNKPFLLYVGQRRRYKNFDGFIKAVAKSKRLMADFNIVAFGGPTFSAREFNLMSSLGFDHGQVQHKSGSDGLLGSYYRAARAFVFPSLYEGFGIPPLEAMAHNCPVVSSNSSSMPEIIGEAAEYFNPAEADDMLRAIESVVYSDYRIECLRKSGTARLSEFSWAKCSRKTLNVYRSLS